MDFAPAAQAFDPVAAKRGLALHQDHCATCHGDTGSERINGILSVSQIAMYLKAHKPASKILLLDHKSAFAKQGYLSKADQLDSRNFVPPAPSQHSARQAFDTAWSEKMLPLRGSARWDLAIRDADLAFPATASTFSCALGIPVTKEDTPALYMLLRRTLADLGLATYSAKKAYQRERPFMTNGEPVCTPEEETTLRKDGSYPSGHTAVGWGWALILSELAPDRAEAVLARGRAFGESRNVCNVHWYSDVAAGRTVGSAAVARLHANDAFLIAMEAARADIDRAQRDGLTPQRDCAAEAAALATVF